MIAALFVVVVVVVLGEAYRDQNLTETQRWNIKRSSVHAEREPVSRLVRTSESATGQCSPGGLWGEANNSEGHWQVALSRMHHKTAAECHSL